MEIAKSDSRTCESVYLCDRWVELIEVRSANGLEAGHGDYRASVRR